MNYFKNTLFLYKRVLLQPKPMIIRWGNTQIATSVIVEIALGAVEYTAITKTKNVRYKTVNCKLSTLAIAIIAIQTVIPFANAATLEINNKESYSQLPSITGVIRRYSIEKPDSSSESWLALSPSGMRITDLTTQSEVVKNFRSKQVWLVNNKKRIQHEVNVSEFIGRFPDMENILVGAEVQSNILGSTPCADWESELHGDRVWRGSVVQDWICKDQSGFIVNRQSFDHRFGIVVRVEHAGGIVEELLDISEKVFDETSFLLDKKFNAVGLTEILTGRITLDKYGE